MPMAFAVFHSGTFDCASRGMPIFLTCGTHAVHEVGGASGDGAVSQGSQVSDYFYRLSTQRIVSVGKTGCHHAVADEADAVVTEHLEGGAYGSRVEMNAVTDQLDADMVTVAGCADNAGSSVREGRHRVVEMGGMTSAAVVSFLGDIIVSRGVGDGDAYLIFQLVDELHGTFLLRSNVTEFDESAGDLLETAEHADIRVVDVDAVLSTFFSRGIRTLHIYATSTVAGLVLKGAAPSMMPRGSPR